MLIYYCYSCSEFFKVSPKKAKNLDNITCPQCGSFDTEYSPEEENSPDNTKYVEATDGTEEDNAEVTEYDNYVEEIEGADDN